jgi:hypothetical protein
LDDLLLVDLELDFEDNSLCLTASDFPDLLEEPPEVDLELREEDLELDFEDNLRFSSGSSTSTWSSTNPLRR